MGGYATPSAANPTATITVNSTAHGTDANGATTTLVEAIQQANLAGGANTIMLPTGLVKRLLSHSTVFMPLAEAVI